MIARVRQETSTLGLPGELLWLPAESIGVDPTYQRPISMYQVNKIKRQFDPDLLGVILISERADGDRMVLDGQHRLEAIRLMGHGQELVPCMVYKHLTLATEAKIFADTNKERLYLSPQYAFRAQLLAGDKRASRIKRTVDTYGFHINTWKPLPGEENSGMNRPEGQITAVGSLSKLYETYSRDMLPEVLSVIRQAWTSDVVGVSGALLTGLGTFLHQYDQLVDRERLNSILADITPKRLEQEGKDRGRTSVGISRYLVEKYNYHLSAKNRLPQRRSSK